MNSTPTEVLTNLPPLLWEDYLIGEKSKVTHKKGFLVFDPMLKDRGFINLISGSAHAVATFW